MSMPAKIEKKPPKNKAAPQRRLARLFAFKFNPEVVHQLIGFGGERQEHLRFFHDGSRRIKHRVLPYRRIQLLAGLRLRVEYPRYSALALATIGAAEEIDVGLRLRLMLGVLSHAHGVHEKVGSLLWHEIADVFIAVLSIHHDGAVARIVRGQPAFLVGHFGENLIVEIALNQRLLSEQLVIRGFPFGLVGGIHFIAQLDEGDTEGVRGLSNI